MKAKETQSRSATCVSAYVGAIIHSSIQSSIHSFIHSLIHLFHSFIHSFIHSRPVFCLGQVRTILGSSLYGCSWFCMPEAVHQHISSHLSPSRRANHLASTFQASGAIAVHLRNSNCVCGFMPQLCILSCMSSVVMWHLTCVAAEVQQCRATCCSVMQATSKCV